MLSKSDLQPVLCMRLLMLCDDPGLNKYVVVTAGSAQSNTTVSRAAPVVLSVSPQIGPAAGNIYIVLVGQYFGVSGNVTIGGNRCFHSSWGHTRVVCALPVGVGSNLAVQVCTDGSGSQCGSNSSVKFAYDLPRVDGVTPSLGVTQGGTVVVLRGANFGANATVTMGARGPCVKTAFVQSDSQIECTCPAGSGYARSVLFRV
jgi:hypothetical protein